ncbi:hypothetical protein LEP1GSC168_0833 [Leptospira santarosai str. HAI134]|nr:hypothetical protein LEP1GSC168_0833 [Leptospira santarosai str. HAI134]
MIRSTTGLIARETVQRDNTLLTSLNNRISELSYVEFLEALPALRMAFSFLLLEKNIR